MATPDLPDIGMLAAAMRRRAAADTFDGRRWNRYCDSCRWQIAALGCTAVFTRDVGYHSSGWWKNPDFERCFHLSLSFWDQKTSQPRPRDPVLTGQFLEALFGRHKRWVWCEPAASKRGRKLDVWHYRLFCDLAWEPIKPRGEVYSRELTEAGWKSYSDVQAALSAEVEATESRR